MNFFSILAAVGLLALAGLAGVALAKIEEKYFIDQSRRNKSEDSGQFRVQKTQKKQEDQE